MKPWKVAVAFGLALACFACGGAAEKDEDESSTRQQCRDLCEKAAECEEDSDSYERACKDSCRTSEELVEDAGCEIEYEDLWDCARTEFECGATAGPGQCAEDSDALFECMVAGAED